ncbi:apicoplast pyruvate carrier 1-like [Tachypleus tridentatus]|uniref:apicoplast pyruvate carrier 1-like n=1 Tax=Tachypleus tridentatus TaxID=6853 RepID=UPI003FD51208
MLCVKPALYADCGIVLTVEMDYSARPLVACLVVDNCQWEQDQLTWNPHNIEFGNSSPLYYQQYHKPFPELFLEMKVRPFVAVFGCFLIYFGLGVLYLLGNIIPYMTSYLRKRVDENTTYEQTSWIAYVTEIISSFFFLGVWVSERIGRRPSIVIGSVIFSFGTTATYWSIQHSVEATIITLGVVVNVGINLCFGFPLAEAMEWFPNNKGLVAGIVSSGMAITPVLMNNLHTLFMNPNNLQPDADGYFSDPEILNRVPSLFLIIGGVESGILFTALFLYKEPPSDVVEEEEVETLPVSIRKEPNSGENTRILIFQEDTSVMTEENPTRRKVEETQPSFPRESSLMPKEALKMKEYYFLQIVCIGSLHSTVFVNNFYKVYGQTFIDDDIYLATTGSASAVVHTTFRVLVGLVQDYTSFKPTILILMGLKTILLFTLVATPYGGKVMFIIWICGLHATFSVEFVSIPAAIADVFGKKHSAMIYGMIYFVAGTSITFWPITFQRIIPYFGWFGAFCSIGTICLIGLGAYPNPSISR